MSWFEKCQRFRWYKIRPWQKKQKKKKLHTGCQEIFLKSHAFYVSGRQMNVFTAQCLCKLNGMRTRIHTVPFKCTSSTYHFVQSTNSTVYYGGPVRIKDYKPHVYKCTLHVHCTIYNVHVHTNTNMALHSADETGFPVNESRKAFLLLRCLVNFVATIFLSHCQSFPETYLFFSSYIKSVNTD